MSLLKLLAILGLLSMVACSTHEDEATSENDDGIELVEEDEELDGSEIVLDDDLVEEGEVQEISDADLEEISESVDDMSIVHNNAEGKGFATYNIQKGDTLMWIAFKIYGDYTKWRHLAHVNTDSISNAHRVMPGAVIKYMPPVQEFDWNPTGNPYLVKRGDTLGTVSKDVYGVMSRWKEIYEHNRPLIRNPNLIFAGFTIYYMADDSVAMK